MGGGGSRRRGPRPAGACARVAARIRTLARAFHDAPRAGWLAEHPSARVPRSAGAPVLAVVSTEEALVHERSAERGVIVEEPRDDAVDLLLVVAPSRFELDRDPFEDHPALRPLRRDLGQAAVAEERPQDLPLGRGV